MNHNDHTNEGGIPSKAHIWASSKMYKTTIKQHVKVTSCTIHHNPAVMTKLNVASKDTSRDTVVSSSPITMVDQERTIIYRCKYIHPAVARPIITYGGTVIAGW